MTSFTYTVFAVSVLGLLANTNALANDRLTPAQVEFFESKIRPVLIEQCYECHNSETSESGLSVDHRAAILKGGDGGKVIVPGSPNESRLLKILRHEVEGLEMPQGGAKLDDQVIADFARWIEMGAPDPRDTAPASDELAKATSWEAVLERRKKWWSFRPIEKAAPPEVADQTWSDRPIDKFILKKLEESGLEPAHVAEPGTLVRRLYFSLIGLPPMPGELARWTSRLTLDSGGVDEAGLEELVAHLLESPHFGERWARHWMDWIRYAESHGSEGDPAIVNAWHYRDYLIRALNADVPLDQLLREHIAGDLLENGRINPEMGINESRIGPSHWRMVFHGFAPTDALDEKVRFTDDQINAFSKAFLGLTVSCARCHDHKFDAISQRDYYAFFGILGSCRPGRVVIDTPDRLTQNREALAALKPRIRQAVADAWRASSADLTERLMADDGPAADARKPADLLHPLFVTKRDLAANKSFAASWNQRVRDWEGHHHAWREHLERGYEKKWDLAVDDDYQQWFRTGTGLPNQPFAPGEFAVQPTGDQAIQDVYPAGVISHGLSMKHAARLTSGKIQLDGDFELWLRVAGGFGASARYVVQDYPRNGTVYPVTRLSPDWRWQRYDLAYWNGDEIHIELSAGKDAPLLVNDEPRSWFAIREAILVKKGAVHPPNEPREFLEPLFELCTKQPPTSLTELSELYVDAITSAVDAWRSGEVSDTQAALLSECIKKGLLPNRLDQLARVKPLVHEYRKLESAIAVPTRVPGLEETVGRDQRLFARGNHKQPTEVVPRRFLEAIDAEPYEATLSGRRQLAEDLLGDENPLTRRVIVNRVWHHLFGKGIVATPDNFGRLGELPTHPELLDWLALNFVEQDWSIKRLIREIVMSRTWQQSSRASEKARQTDPDNDLLSHANLRRLEAEAIRDGLLSVSGRLERRLFGAPMGGESSRRSIYVRVRRNSLDSFLRVFDFPEPFSATGRRDVTNVPAQSLTMMNDPRITGLASSCAARLLEDENFLDDEQRVRRLVVSTLGRAASSGETDRLLGFVDGAERRYAEIARRVANIQQRINENRAAVNDMIEPMRERLVAALEKKQPDARHETPRPIGRWEFEGNLEDAIGTAHGRAVSGARIEDGALIVDSSAYVLTAPIQKTLKEKTLEAWVQLDNLNQRGGGVMTVQSQDGVIFDAIVFGERNIGQWMAGSNGFVRTRDFAGPVETEAIKRAVHVAIAYHADGRIVGYRNGEPYGEPYKSDGPNEFKAGNTIIGFGIRHLPAGGNRMLAGRVMRAQLYDRALTAEEIRATAQSAPFFVSEAQVLANLSEDERAHVTRKQQEIRDLETQLESFGPIPKPGERKKAAWTQLVQAMFTVQEFIYVK